jgi:hypothetical protein
VTCGGLELTRTRTASWDLKYPTYAGLLASECLSRYREAGTSRKFEVGSIAALVVFRLPEMGKR